MQYTGDIDYNPADDKYYNELINYGFPVMFKEKKDGVVLDKTASAFAIDKLAEGPPPSVYKQTLYANAEHLKTIGFFPSDVEYFKKIIDLVCGEERSDFTRNLSKLSSNSMGYGRSAADQQVLLKGLLTILDAENNMLDALSMSEIEKYMAPSEKDLYAEDDIDDFKLLHNYISRHNKLIAGRYTNKVDFKGFLGDFIKSKGLTLFDTFPRRVELHDIQEEKLQFYNSDNFQYYDKLYVIEPNSNTGLKQSKYTIITDKRPESIPKTTIEKNGYSTKDESVQLVGIDDNKGNQSVALYHLIVDKDRYVTTRPIYYITIAATPKFTHPNTSNEAVNYNLDYYHLLYWNGLDVYVSIQTFQMQITGRNKINAGTFGNVVAVAYEYRDALKELDRIVHLLEHIENPQLNSLEKNTAAYYYEELYNQVMKKQRYKPSDSIESYLEIQSDLATAGKNNSEGSETEEEIW